MDDAARMLGKKPGQVMRQLHMPLLKPSILTASLLVFVESLKELPATLILRPFNFETLATMTYQLASDERLVDSSVSALVLVLVGVVSMVLVQKSEAWRS